jgi:serralysin
VYTYNQIADLLVNGDGNAQHFNVAPGGTLTVSLTALTPEGQALARAALGMWSDVIGVTFVEVASGAHITFDDSDTGAYAIYSWLGEFTTSASVNVGLDWLSSYGTGLNSYSFQTYIHEIGHALGLSHPGSYNGSADYASDALFLNDAWSTTVMSYFDQSENAYFANQGFTDQYVLSPMAADILAMSLMYGLSTTTRTGNTTYGFGSNAGRDVLDAALYPNVAYTIIDSGGVDTLNYSGYSANQVINLNTLAFSNVGTGVGNVMIAWGTVIENAQGGSGSDAIYGNAAKNKLIGNGGNDILNGGLGADKMHGGLGNDTYTVDAGGDVVLEGEGQGIDLVKSKVSFTLGNNVERLTLTGRGAIDGTGNNAANLITGNGSANVLSGRGANDTIKGGAGADDLHGGAGNDRLTGGSGADDFYFDTGLSGSMNVDRITDFSGADDSIYLDRSIFRAISTDGPLSAAAFRLGAAAADAEDRIIYDSATGKIYYDADGSGAGAKVLFAQVTAGTTLTNADFIAVGVTTSRTTSSGKDSGSEWEAIFALSSENQSVVPLGEFVEPARILDQAQWSQMQQISVDYFSS